MMASMTSKSFTFWSHFVLSPPATGLMHSQTLCGLPGRIPSPLYLRGTERTRAAPLPPARSTARGPDPAPRQRALLTDCQRTPPRVSRTPPPHPAGWEAFSARAEPALGPRSTAPTSPDPPCCGSPASRRDPRGRAAAARPPPQRAPHSPWRGGRALRSRFERPRRAAPGPISAAPHLRVTPARPGPVWPHGAASGAGHGQSPDGERGCGAVCGIRGAAVPPQRWGRPALVTAVIPVPVTRRETSERPTNQPSVSKGSANLQCCVKNETEFRNSE